MTQFAHPKGCVLWYNFATLEGIKVYDQSGYGNHGTIYGARWLRGPIGGMLNFDGVNDYVEVPDSASLRVDAGNKFTIEAWANLKPFTSGFLDRFIVRKSTTWNNGFGLWYQWDIDQIRVRVWWTDGTETKLQFSRPDVFVHVVATYDGSTLRLFKDGSLYSSTVIGKTMQDTTGFPVYISHSARVIKGDIALARIYDRALSAEEIKAHYYYYLTRLKQA